MRSKWATFIKSALEIAIRERERQRETDRETDRHTHTRTHKTKDRLRDIKEIEKEKRGRMREKNVYRQK